MSAYGRFGNISTREYNAKMAAEKKAPRGKANKANTDAWTRDLDAPKPADKRKPNPWTAPLNESGDEKRASGVRRDMREALFDE